VAVEVDLGAFRADILARSCVALYSTVGKVIARAASSRLDEVLTENVLTDETLTDDCLGNNGLTEDSLTDDCLGDDGFHQSFVH